MRILETTLRDGSYAVDFKFTAADMADIAIRLERAGVDMIEIGHGVGLGASEKGFGQAVETDENYLSAAADCLKKAWFGMFCIPGIADLEHVDMAADYGARFIRIGANVSEVDTTEKFIDRAKKRGLYVSTNLMKSYTLPPDEFAQKALLPIKYGADLICVVDSAGGMLQEELTAYFEAMRNVSDIPLGFHGHNNLGLAMANSLKAIQMGAEIVDSSLQGLGRSAGNTPTEQLLAALDRMGIETGIDTLAIMEVGDELIRPLLRIKGLSPLDVTMGMALFHSSYMSVIRKYSSKYRVDPRMLIIELCKHDKVNAPEDLVERLAQNLNKSKVKIPIRLELTHYTGDEQKWMK